MSADAPPDLSSLWQRVNDLSTQVILGGASADRLPEFTESLARIGEQAQAAGLGETASLAAALAEQIQAGEDPGTSEISLREGLVQLQRALHGASEPEAEPAPAPPVNPLAEDPELLSDFILESRDHLASIETQLLTLEREPANREAVHTTFRGFHTIKGLAGFLDLTAIREVSHEVETLLDLARDGRLAITPAVIDVVLQSGDYLKESIRLLEESLAGGAPRKEVDQRPLLEGIRALDREDAAAPPATSPASPAEQPAAERSQRQRGATEVFKVRVDAAKLDYLMDMVGEMVITQSMVRHHPMLAAVHDSRLSASLSQLSRITGEVQRTAMALRMVPIGQLFQRTARVVRDLARKAGKQVEMETAGEDTELDKTIAEELADPLMHMVRNAIDHGVEPPEERQAAGKQATARLRLAAYHQAGQIVVEVADDGRGLNRDSILLKAQQKGLVEPGSHLSENEIYNLIFEPGFSTADQITEVSGRGVGMDVVRKQVQKLRGRVDIESKGGQGTRFSIRLPLTLAIIDGLVVAVGGHRYIIPVFAVREMFRPAPEQISTLQGREEMAQVRGRLLPIVRLHGRFAVEPRYQNPSEALLIVAESEGRAFCLMVDELIGKQEVVIKSLGETFKDVPGIAGGAILGDGRVGLILDTAGLYRKSAA